MNWRFAFSALQSPYWAVSVALLVAVAFVLFVVLRRYEARLVSRFVSFVLLALRCLTLLFLLAVLLQPVLTRGRSVDEQPRVVIGFDVSDSMETVDRHAAPDEMLRWAQALGMVRGAEAQELINDWVAAFEAGEQPDWLADAGEGISEQVAAVRKEHIGKVFETLRGMSRIEFVRRLLQSPHRQLIGSLEQSNTVELHLFGQDTRIVDGEILKAPVTAEERAIDTSGTDAMNLMRTAVASAEAGQLTGIVLFTDGRQTAKGGRPTQMSVAASLGVPVYCVPIGSRLQPRDLAVVSVQSPQSVFLKDAASIQAVISAVGFRGEEQTVHLNRNGKTIDRRTIAVTGDSFEVEFAVPTEEVGTFDYEISTAVQPGELRDDNNDRGLTISVVDSRTRVMLVEGDARWEFRYLNSALERDERVELTTVLFHQPSLGLLRSTFIDSSLPVVDELDDQLGQSDILIIGDVVPERLPDGFWDRVDLAVTQDGLTLLVIPGRRAMPHKHTSEIFRRLLPLSDPREQLAERYVRTPGDGPASVFRLHPAPTTGDLPLFRFDQVQDSAGITLDRLPGHPWAFSGTPKPAASVWATLQMQNTELPELPAVVHQYYGFGQVLWLGVDSTWRWRRRAGDLWHHRFWGQLVRWAARNKSAAGNDQVRMTLSDIIVSDSQSTDVSVRWDRSLADQLQNASVSVEVRQVDRADGEQADAPQKIELSPLQGTTDQYSARLPPLPAGSYQVELQVEGAPFKLEQSVISDLLVRQTVSSELANVSCHRELLQQIAADSAGRVLEPWELDQLPELLTPRTSDGETTVELTLWDHWGVMVIFFALLTAEWVVRRMNGLP